MPTEKSLPFIILSAMLFMVWLFVPTGSVQAGGLTCGSSVNVSNNNINYDYIPQINGDFVVWQGSDSSGDNDIYLC